MNAASSTSTSRPTFPMPHRLLLVKLSSLGDIVHALPLVESLRIGLPHTPIAWAVRGTFADILTGNPHIDKLHILKGNTASDIWRFGGSTLRREKFDMVLDAQGLLKSGILAGLANSPTRIGFDTNREFNRHFLTHPIVPSREHRHMVDKLMGFCDVLDIERQPIHSQTYLVCGESAVASTLLEPLHGKPIAGFVIGASRMDKAWLPERWIETAKILIEKGCRVVLLGGKAEIPLGEEIADSVNSKSLLNLAGKTPLRVLAATLAQCNTVVGGDSGPLHLAVAVGTPVVGLYGVTDPIRTGPAWSNVPTITLDFAEKDAPPELRRARHTVLTDALSRIPAIAVGEAVEKLLRLSQGAKR